MSKTFVVANWKMNPATMREAKRLFDATKKVAESSRAASVIVAPPAIFLRELTGKYRGSKVAFAVQHARFEAGGAHTGDISLTQAKDAKARYCVVGHAERRAQGETDDDVRKKTAAALALKISPIVCVGESERTEGGKQFDVVREQLRVALADVPASALSRALIVYEPLWTVGKDTTMNPHEMHQMAIFMRKCVVDTHGNGGRTMKILYGGSVDKSNARAMLEEGDVRGFLVGRAGLSAKAFTDLMHSIE